MKWQNHQTPLFPSLIPIIINGATKNNFHSFSGKFKEIEGALVESERKNISERSRVVKNRWEIKDSLTSADIYGSGKKKVRRDTLLEKAGR